MSAEVPRRADELGLEYVPPEKLRPFAGNPRRISAAGLAKLRRSIERFGFLSPIIAQRSTGVVIAGNQRLKAAKESGLERVPVIWVDLDDDEAKAYNIADNRLQEEAEWDPELLAGLVRELEGRIDLSLTGLDEEQLEELLHAGAEALGDEDDHFDVNQALEEIVEPRCQPGEVWQLGRHRIACGDSTRAEIWEALLGGERVDLVVTSPPYNVGKPYHGSTDRRERDEYLAFIESVGAHIMGHLKPGRFVAWNTGVSPQSYPHHQVVTLERCGLRFYRQIVWQKDGVAFPIFPATLRTRRARHYTPNYTHEMIYLFEAPGARELPELECPVCDGSGRVRGFVAPETADVLVLMTNGRPELGEKVRPSKRYAHDVWRISQAQATMDLPTLGEQRTGFENKRPHRVKAHPAAFPVELPRAVMLFLSAEGETVLDPFVGAGATIIAAEMMGRVGYGIEIDPIYCELAMQRWERFTGQEAVQADATRPAVEAHA